ncbi:MAG: hypothetical protein ACRDG8_02690 [Actinomycetota bacterium]
MRPLLAHQGGWDELLLAAVLVLAMLGVSRLRRRASATGSAQEGPPADDTCAYCGAAMSLTRVRCPSCGFRRGASHG